MTIDTWLIVATIISAIMLAAATLLAPSLAEVVKVRVSQPKATPVTNQPKSRALRIAAWAKWWSVGGILLNIAVLIILLLRSSGITRFEVVLIATAVGGIYHYLMVAIHNRFLDSLSRLFLDRPT